MAQEKLYKTIDISDINLYPFEVYKQYNVSSSAEFNTTTSGYELNRAIYPYNNAYPKKKLPISSSLTSNEPKNWNNKEQKLYYYHLNTYHYDRLLNSVDYEFVPTLYNSSSILSIPYHDIGEGVKRNSFEFTSSNGTTLKDDGNGNILDVSLTSTTLNPSSSIIYVSSNNEVDIKKVKYVLHENPSKKKYEINISNIQNAINFETSSTLILDDTQDEQLFNIDQNYAISFDVNLATNLYDKSVITAKRNYIKSWIYDKSSDSNNIRLVEQSSPIYPFEISFISSSYIRYRGSDGLNSFEVTSSDLVNNTEYHIVCQKTGSVIELYINNDVSQSDYNLTLNQNNNALIEIGRIFTGSIDEFRVIDQALSIDEVSNVYTNARQTNKIGNIFYNSGIIALNDTRAAYQELLFTTSESIDKGDFSFKFKATQTIYENEIFCKVRQDEFNHTLNPTVRKNNNIQSTILKDFATGSDFNPYVTEIGLYNDEGELLAISKLATPVPKLNNIDMNFLIRFDI